MIGNVLILTLAPSMVSMSMAQEITGLTLIDALHDVPIDNVPLRNGATVNLREVGTSLSIRADVDENVKSVRFTLDGKQKNNIENVAPFSLSKDHNGDYSEEPVLSVPSTHTISATPYSEKSEGGIRGNAVSVTIQIVNRAPTPTSTDVSAYKHGPNGVLNGKHRKWHKITLGFDGPTSNERASPNPFTYYRLDVSFQHSETGSAFVVPGYFAADGNSANTGATEGNVWLVHFTPNEAGIWRWRASFTKGANVAQLGGGISGGFMDGKSGLFEIHATNKSGRDLRGKGRLQYVGEHHLQFAETGKGFLKVGADSPENFLAYNDFDNTPDNGHRTPIKTWAPHQQDYSDGDPTWGGGKGTEIIGAINYLSAMGMNAFSFLTMNIDGDDRKVFPYVSDLEVDRLRIDVSKTAQWEVVFEHADHKGMYLHFKTQEIENDHLLDGGNLGRERKLYYRELVARFGHHLALNWNIGEENSNTPLKRIAFANFFKEIDPYQHPVVIHNHPSQKQEVYSFLLGVPGYDGASIQTDPPHVFDDTLEWLRRSSMAGKKWVVANDEQGSAGTGVVPDVIDPHHDVIRENVLWDNIMAGGGGVEYYFGYNYANSDLSCEDFRSRHEMWTQSKYALDFFETFVPFWEMSNKQSMVSPHNNKVRCLANDDVIVVYLKGGGVSNPSIDLSSLNHTYDVKWYDPRNGGALQQGSIGLIKGGESNNNGLGDAPNSPDKDWAILLRRV